MGLRVMVTGKVRVKGYGLRAMGSGLRARVVVKVQVRGWGCLRVQEGLPLAQVAVERAVRVVLGGPQLQEGGQGPALLRRRPRARGVVVG